MLSKNSSKAMSSILFFTLLILIVSFSASRAEADTLYEGKCSDVFKGYSIEIANESILQKIVDQIKPRPGIINISILLVCAVSSSNSEAPKDLANQRMLVLKRYFADSFPKANISGKDRTAIQNEYQIKNYPPYLSDKLVIEVFGEVGAWQKPLLARYEVVQKELQFLCEQRKRKPGDLSSLGCGSNGVSSSISLEDTLQSSLENMQCQKNYALYRGTEIGTIRMELKFQLKQIKRHIEISDELYAIAKEIALQKPSVKMIDFDKKTLIDAVKDTMLGISYEDRTIKIADQAMRHLPQLAKLRLSNFTKYSNAYSEWIGSDHGMAYIVSTENGFKNMNPLRALHRFVRSHLGLRTLDINEPGSVCIFAANMITTNLKQTMLNQRAWSTADRMELEIPDIPLE